MKKKTGDSPRSPTFERVVKSRVVGTLVLSAVRTLSASMDLMGSVSTSASGSRSTTTSQICFARQGMRVESNSRVIGVQEQLESE